MTVTPSTPVAVDVSAAGESERQQARRETWHLLRRRPGYWIGVGILLGWIVCAIGGQRLAPYSPFDDFDKRGSVGPRAGHWFGTDRLGRDVLSRVIAGARDVLVIAPVAAILGVALGTMFGLVMGYYRGVLDEVLSRVIEAVLSLPVILISLLALVVFGNSRLIVVELVGVLFTPIVARTVRSAVIAERNLDYVTSAKLRGEGGFFIMFREILPNIRGPIIVELTVRIGYAIFTIATLSFLGVGLKAPSPDWGLSISEEYSMMNSGIWWTTLFPALAIASLVVAVNLIADSLQAVLDQ